MIKSLYVKNFVLVDEIKVIFDSGLNIITGETGAGKSIIVNAIGQLCGERSSTELVRTGTKKAIIEAEINIKDILNFEPVARSLDLEIDDSNSIIVRKEINANGASRIFINDSPINLTRLNAFSFLLFDFHGQHQHQRLLNPDHHITYLDSFGSLKPKAREFGELYNQYLKFNSELDDLKSDQLRAFQMQDMYRYQNEELNKVNLEEDELDKLKSEMKILSNIEYLHQSGKMITDALYNGEVNASGLLSKAETDLQNLAELDEQFAGLKINLQSALDTVEEIGRFTEQYLADLSFDPERMEFIHQRIAQLEFLLKKYQKSNISELIKLHYEINQMLGDIDQYDEDIKNKENEINRIILNLNQAGQELSGLRAQVATQFQGKITDILTKIGMPNAKFRVKQSFEENNDSDFEISGKMIVPGKNGFDQILFEISSNAGESYYPLHRIASGGEISRIMLAIKSVLAETDQIPVLIFDEIDAGISGKIAQIVGKNLFDLSKYHQIICVTHLPQIAAFSNSHYKVEKQVEANRTIVNISILDGEEQIQEIAHLLGGVDISSHALENARHLISESKKTQ